MVSSAPLQDATLYLISRKVIVMFSNRIALIITALMLAASVGAVVARPSVKVSDEAPISLEKIIPLQFGDWREEPQRYVQVVNPQTQEMLDKIYSQLLSRVYV